MAIFHAPPTWDPIYESDPPIDVLIADDDQGSRELIMEIVADLGYSIEECDRAATALFLLHKRRPRLLILDVMLPDGNGLDILNLVRADPVIADTRVLICTAAMLELIGRPLPPESPHTVLIFKPFHIDMLIGTLQNLLASYKGASA